MSTKYIATCVNCRWVSGSSRPLSATTESASQNVECSKEESDAANGSGVPEKHLQDVIESLTKENESLSKKVADFQVISSVLISPVSYGVTLLFLTAC